MNPSHSTSSLQGLADDAVEEKKRRRLERNRESARECRKRKKDKIVSLKQQLTLLEADNLQLRLKLQVGPEAAKIRGEKVLEITNRLEAMIREGSSEVNILDAVTELQEKYSDYGRDRRSAIQFHIHQLRRCLQPTQTTRTMLWLISCAPLFHERNGTLKPKRDDDMSKLWYDLLDNMEPTAEQCQALMDLALSPLSSEGNKQYSSAEEVSDESEKMLNRLEELATSKNETLDNEMAEIQSILSASQIAKFILWIHQNPAVMQMLEALWPHMTHSITREKSDTSESE